MVSQFFVYTEMYNITRFHKKLFLTRWFIYTTNYIILQYKVHPISLSISSKTQQLLVKMFKTIVKRK